MSKDTTALLSFILGNGSVLHANQKQTYDKVNRKLVMSSAMFWDSKKRIQKIKTLFLTSLDLKQFDDTQDFKVFELQNIELLSLSKNQIIHLHPISQLTTLVSLNISFNKVYDLNPLSKLQKLEELYASNNEIKTVQPLKQLKQLKNLQLYKNKIHNFKETFQTLAALSHLAELDIGENPVAQDDDFISLISNSFPGLKKLNGQLNKTTQKIKEMSSSKAFMNTSIKGFGTTSMFFTANPSTVNIDAQKTFYNFCKKKSSTKQSWERRKQKENILNKLQSHYKQLDEQFEKEIVKNVRLKNRLYKMMETKKMMENQKEDTSAKAEETKQLKRKIKALKEQLFTKDRKGELLRNLFQVQIMTKQQSHPQSKLDGDSNNNESESTQSQLQRLEGAMNEIRWTRKFEADQVIVIEGSDKYLEGEQEDMNQLLGSIEHSIRELKSDMDYLS